MKCTGTLMLALLVATLNCTEQQRAPPAETQSEQSGSHMTHSDGPVPGDASPAQLQAMAEKLRSSEYFSYLAPLRAAVIGKTVVSSRAGTAGILLTFSDNTWVLAYLTPERLAYELGTGLAPAEALAQLNSTAVGDASGPLPDDRPYAQEHNDIAAEVSHAHGQKVMGLAHGANCFNFTFPQGMELDTSIVRDQNGARALRVFWEQW